MQTWEANSLFLCNSSIIRRTFSGDLPARTLGAWKSQAHSEQPQPARPGFSIHVNLRGICSPSSRFSGIWRKRGVRSRRPSAIQGLAGSPPKSCQQGHWGSGRPRRIGSSPSRRRRLFRSISTCEAHVVRCRVAAPPQPCWCAMGGHPFGPRQGWIWGNPGVGFLTSRAIP